MKVSERTSTRREPKQQRARQTVEAVLDAVQRVLRRHGAEAITTNRVAEAAGVSIGSLYQYFPSKEALVAELLEKYSVHFQELVIGMLSHGQDHSPRAVAKAIVRAEPGELVVFSKVTERSAAWYCAAVAVPVSVSTPSAEL